MSKYLLETHHTPDQCLKALDDMLAKSPETLQKFEFGCMAGDHTGWATVDAKSENEARSYVPLTLRTRTKVVQVGTFTPEQIRSFHATK